MWTVLAEEAAAAVATAPDLTRVQALLVAVLALQVLTAIYLAFSLRKVAQNEVELGDLIRRAVEQIESDLPKK